MKFFKRIFSSVILPAVTVSTSAILSGNALTSANLTASTLIEATVAGTGILSFSALPVFAGPDDPPPQKETAPAAQPPLPGTKALHVEQEIAANTALELSQLYHGGGLENQILLLRRRSEKNHHSYHLLLVTRSSSFATSQAVRGILKSIGPWANEAASANKICVDFISSIASSAIGSVIKSPFEFCQKAYTSRWRDRIVHHEVEKLELTALNALNNQIKPRAFFDPLEGEDMSFVEAVGLKIPRTTEKWLAGHFALATGLGIAAYYFPGTSYLQTLATGAATTCATHFAAYAWGQWGPNYCNLFREDIQDRLQEVIVKNIEKRISHHKILPLATGTELPPLKALLLKKGFEEFDPSCLENKAEEDIGPMARLETHIKESAKDIVHHIGVDLKRAEHALQRVGGALVHRHHEAQEEEEVAESVKGSAKKNSEACWKCCTTM